MCQKKNSNNCDARERQANREALLTLAAYAAYFIWWYAFAYGLGDGDPENYSYVLGLPAWFFYSCIAGYLLLSLVLWLMVRFFFKEIPLDGEPDEAEDSTASALLQAAGPGEEEAGR